MTSLENRTRHNIPLDRALQAVAANGEIPVNLNDLLDNHHYVTVPVLTTVIIIIILIGAIIGAMVIKRVKADARAVRQTLNYQNQAFGIMQETVRNMEQNRDDDDVRPRKHQAPMPPPTAPLASPIITYRPPHVPPLYLTTSRPLRRGYSLGASPSLEADMLGTAATTAGHSLGMHHEQAAAMLGFQFRQVVTRKLSGISGEQCQRQSTLRR
jgi:hypothetical protein